MKPVPSYPTPGRPSPGGCDCVYDLVAVAMQALGLLLDNSAFVDVLHRENSEVALRGRRRRFNRGLRRWLRYILALQCSLCYVW